MNLLHRITNSIYFDEALVLSTFAFTYAIGAWLV